MIVVYILLAAPVGVAHASDSFSFLLSKLLSKPLDCVDTEPLFEKLACNFTEVQSVCYCSSNWPL